MTLNTITPAVLAYTAPDSPLEEFVPDGDRAQFADPKKAQLLAAASGIEDLTPYIGTELKGLQISNLTDVQKDELALLVAEVYHMHDLNHSFEINPPSYTLLRMIKTPPSGGDTIFTSQTALFDKLSLPFQKALEGLHGIHSAERSYLSSINGGGKPHRAPIATAHPLIRTHPITALKVLNYNPSFIDRVQELNGQESNHILAFLREHLLQADDLSVRWKWTPGSIAFWDNRSVVHKAMPGGYDVTLREGTRTAIHGERPFWDPERSESLTERKERLEKELGAVENGVHISSEPELNN
ncbi:MAG: hypothetical protein Q9190_000705 [Brigantiaea leucoxantha]